MFTVFILLILQTFAAVHWKRMFSYSLKIDSLEKLKKAFWCGGMLEEASYLDLWQG